MCAVLFFPRRALFAINLSKTKFQIQEGKCYVLNDKSFKSHVSK